jgi:hypothetical protein
MSGFRTVAPTPAAPAATGTPQAGRWTQTVHSDASVPFTQAAIGGGLISSLIVVILGLIVYWRHVAFVDVALPVFTAGLIVFLGVAIWLYFRQLSAVERTWFDPELALEMLTGRDIDGGGIGKHPLPAAHPFPVGSYVPTPQVVEANWHETAAWFVERCFESDKRGERAHVGQPRPDGGKFLDEEYRELRDTLIRAGFAEWRDPGRLSLGWTFRPGLTAEQVIGGLRKYARE